MKASLTIGIVAASGFVTDLAVLERAAGWFEHRGHRVVIDDAVCLRAQRFAGSDTERIASLHRMFRAPEIDIVMAARGGYGMARLLDGIDYGLIARSGKLFAGHSDCTALQLALWSQSRTASLAGATACYDFGSEDVSQFFERHFWTALEGQPFRIEVEAAGQPACAASGTLWGGNLCTLANLAGTPWLPAVEAGILFLEDVYEHPYRIERMLLQLHHAGVLDKQAAVLLGTFNGYKLLDNDNGYDLDAAIAWIRAKTRTPILTGLPYGHIRDKVSLPVGGLAEVASVGPGSGGWSLTIAPPAAPGEPWHRLQ